MFDLTDEVLLRFGASRVMARPEYNRIAPTITSFTPLLFTGTGGNPDARSVSRRPVRPVGRVVLRARVRCWRRRCSTRTCSRTWSTAPDPSVCPRKSSIRTTRGSRIRMRTASTSAPALYSCIYQIDRPVNGPGGQIQGVELSWQQPIAGGFGAHRELHLLGCRLGERRSGARQLGEHRQPHGVLRERALRRTALVQLPFGVLHRQRSRPRSSTRMPRTASTCRSTCNSPTTSR